MSQISVERTADKSATGFQLFNSLAKGELRPGRLWHARNYRTKFVLRTFLAPIATMKLLNNIAAIPLLPRRAVNATPSALQAAPPLPQRPLQASRYSQSDW